MRKISILFAFAVSSGPVFGTQTEGTPASAKPVVENRDRTECRTTPIIGSRLGKNRVCRTVAQWADHDRTVQRDFMGAQGPMYNCASCERPGPGPR